MYKRMAKLAPIFPIYKIMPDGQCQCGSPDCAEAGKHPSWGNWKNVDRMSNEDYDDFASIFSESYGVLVRDLLVIDVDARNGGLGSLVLLLESIPELTQCGLIVDTGSGGGSQHFYFRAPQGMALRTKLDDFPGIDFKSSGFVVGPGSKHRSGKTYTVHSGAPEEVGDAPAALVALLERPKHHRVTVDGSALDVTDDEIEDMLRYIDADCEYDAWTRIGMAIHAATQGQGFELWNEWSASGSKYPGQRKLKDKWESFRDGGGVSAGTLYYYAQQAGWVRPVTFVASEEPPVFRSPGGANLHHPPGFVGQVAKWINDNCLYPRETLATAAALHAIGAICALRYTDDFKVRTNLMTIGIASSGSGKNAVIEAVGKLLHAAGLAPATYGRIKSERDLLNTLLMHQCSHYYMDELGEQLSKAMGKNVATHNIGLVGTIMEVMTKANGYMPIEGAEKARIKADLHARKALLEKMVRENEDPDGNIAGKEIPRLRRAITQIEYGIEKPVFSLIGVASPISIAGGMDRNLAENGFIRRSLLAWEHEANPRAKPGFKPVSDVPFDMSMRLLAFMGNHEHGAPIEHREALIEIPTEAAARDRLQAIQEEVWEAAEEQKARSGLVAIAREVYHNTLKISLILAIPGGRRTLEHVEWAYAYAKRNAEETMLLVMSNDKDQDALYSKILLQVGADWVKESTLKQNLKHAYKPEDVKQGLERLVQGGHLEREEHRGKRGPAALVYRRAQ